MINQRTLRRTRFRYPVWLRPWFSISLEEDEEHMSAANVAQFPVLAEFFRYVLERLRPESVAVPEVAGGNGLEATDTSVTKRIVGLDINQKYLPHRGRREDG